MDYVELRELVRLFTPKEFIDGFIVRRYWEGQCPDSIVHYYLFERGIQINNDNLLPDQINIIDKKDGNKGYLPYKGQQWFFDTLLRFEASSRQDLFPALFIYSFLREYEPDGYYGQEKVFKLLGFDKAYNFIKASKKELVEARYPLPHNSVKHFLLLSTNAENNMWDLQIIDQGEKLKQIVNNPIDFARLIVDTVCSCVDEYDFEYWRYSSEEYQRVANIYIQARRAFQEDLFSRFK